VVVLPKLAVDNLMMSNSTTPWLMVKTHVDAVIEVKRELRSMFVKTDEQIKKGRKCTKVVKREESIYEEIKNVLKEEIAEGVISTRTSLSSSEFSS
jgi:hypothetical protein